MEFSTYTCENCGSTRNGEYGDSLKSRVKNGKSKYRFCSKNCSRSYCTRAKRSDIYERVSKTLKARNTAIKSSTTGVNPPVNDAPQNYCIRCGTAIKKFRVFCSTSCSCEHKKEMTLKSIEENGYHISYRQVKKYLIRKYGQTCSICGFHGDWNGKPIVMIADHINGRSADNRLENMRLVCPMCDTQLDTFKSKNKNSIRSGRGRSSGAARTTDE